MPAINFLRRLLAKIHPAVVAVIATGAAIRVALLSFTSLFTTDVLYYNAQASGYLLNGLDPYGAAYRVPAYLATAGASTVFAYLPGVFAFLPGFFAFIAPSMAVWAYGLGMVGADLVIALSLYFLAKSRRWVYPVLYLFFPPVVLFSTWFVNDSLPAIAFLSVAIVLEARGKPKWAPLLWGAALASSQEVWLLFPLYAYYLLRGRRFRELVVSLGTVGGVLVPFYLWNPTAFVYDTVLFQFGRQAVGLISTGPFGLTVNASLQGVLIFLGTSAPLALRAALAGVALVPISRRVGASLSSLMLACTAFASVALFLLPVELFWSYFELPFLTGIAWVALRKPVPAE